MASHINKKKMRNNIIGKALQLFSVKRRNTSITMKKMKKQKNIPVLFNKYKRSLKLLKHNNYTFVSEYEFSPSRSNTTTIPLFFHKGFRRKKKGKGKFFLNFLRGAGAAAAAVLPTSTVTETETETEDKQKIAAAVKEKPDVSQKNKEIANEMSIDQKAEKFIKNFYEEIRKQGQQHDHQHNEMFGKKL